MSIACATIDRLGRPLGDLRISVTDRCNLRCTYCMPKEVFGDDFRFMPIEDLLSFEEIVRLARIFAGLGVRKIRLTGGEPLLRRGLERLVAKLAEIEGVEEVALTTNGTLLAKKARALKDAGLTRVTVSLDSTDPQVFRALSDTRAPLARVLAGIDAAGEVGLEPVKINMVVRRGVNDHCVPAMAEHFRRRSETLRFVEFMDVGSTNRWNVDEVVPVVEIRRSIEDRWPLQALGASAAGEVATRYRYRDGSGEIGFIHSVSKPFCASCTRARLSADGKIYTCLFATRGHDLRALLRDGAGDARLEQVLREIWTARGDRYSAERSATPRRSRNGNVGDRSKVEMSYIGG